MNWIFALAGLLLLGVAAYAVWKAFQTPKFIGKLTAWASKKASAAIAAGIKEAIPKITAPETPEDREARIEAERRADGDDHFRRKSGGPPKG